MSNASPTGLNGLAVAIMMITIVAMVFFGILLPVIEFVATAWRMVRP